MFSVGEKVVCIGDFRLDEDHSSCGVRYPIKGDIYTLRTIQDDEGHLYFRLEEIINPKVNYSNVYDECQFASEGFRKLDHSFAEEILAKIREEVYAEEHNLTLIE